MVVECKTSLSVRMLKYAYRNEVDTQFPVHTKGSRHFDGEVVHVK